MDPDVLLCEIDNISAGSHHTGTLPMTPWFMQHHPPFLRKLKVPKIMRNPQTLNRARHQKALKIPLTLGSQAYWTTARHRITGLPPSASTCSPVSSRRNFPESWKDYVPTMSQALKKIHNLCVDAQDLYMETLCTIRTVLTVCPELSPSQNLVWYCFCVL